ncbi:MAG: NPCBM/NEW2 domain-containing protein, partial [Planctomycetes bacterium]|nr:NPCBM/NEW2 domain-containing protein [Planctomycetota bacterium]
MTTNFTRNMSKTLPLVLLLTFAVAAGARTVVRLVNIDELDVSKVQTGWGTPHRNQSVEGNPIRIGGRQFDRGIGTHAPSAFWLELDGWVSDFT